MNRLWRWGACYVGAGLVLSSCGSGTTPAAPSPGGGSGGNASITITITSSGVSPKQLTVVQGTRVQFVNNDTRPRTMNSDPHPEHTDCPEINNIGFITPGQLPKETGNLNIIRTCGYHDHDNPDDARFKGQIIIH